MKITMMDLYQVKFAELHIEEDGSLSGDERRGVEYVAVEESSLMEDVVATLRAGDKAMHVQRWYKRIAILGLVRVFKKTIHDS